MAFFVCLCLVIPIFYYLYKNSPDSKTEKPVERDDSEPRLDFLTRLLLALKHYEENNSGNFSSNDSDTEHGSYMIQYRKSGSWWNVSGSNNERYAELMFDHFINNDRRASHTRCRLVRLVDGRVKAIIATHG